MTQTRYSPVFHVVALLTSAATLVLIGVGGLVTSHGAGMSVPDWPNSYGYNMFLFPPRLWIGGVFYEHSHRLMATAVGMLAITLVVLAFLKESRRWVRHFTVAILAGVIIQGVLGGLRVILKEIDLAPIHACVAQAFFCTTAALAVITSRWWIDAPDLSHSSHGDAGRALLRATAVVIGLIYLQLIVGAWMRHFGAGLAIPDLPLAYGHLLPPMTDAQLKAANHARAWMPVEAGQTPLGRVTLGQIWLHFGHRMGALLVTLAIVVLASMVLRKHRRSGLVFPAISLLALLVTQLTLGVLTVLLRKPADISSLHVACGALMLGTTAVLWVRSARLYSPRPAPAPPARGFPVIPAHA
jgi:cytochrome c oxidase assembly protein subunit 15